MITKGRNSVSLYARGRNISLAVKGKRYIIAPYLSNVVKERIFTDYMALIGYTEAEKRAMAMKVWKATDAYCMAKDASLPSAQTSIKSYIDADPDMYCSLPISVSAEALSSRPVMWVVGSGTGFFNTGLVPTQYPLRLGGRFLNAVASGERDFFGNFGGGNSSVIFVAGMNGMSAYMWYNGVWSAGSIPSNTKHTIEYEFIAASGRKMIIDGVTYTSSISNNMNSAYPISIFSGGGTRDYSCPSNGSKCADLHIICNNIRHDYAILKISNSIELLDLYDLSLLSRTGNFTESKE